MTASGLFAWSFLRVWKGLLYLHLKGGIPPFHEACSESSGADFGGGPIGIG